METADFIGRIYESIGDAAALAETVKGIVQISRSRGAQFGLLDRAGTWIQANVVGFDPAALELYLKNYASEDPRVPYFLQSTGQFIFCRQAIRDPATFERSALVNEFLNRNEARFAMFVGFPVGPNHAVSLSLMRSRLDGQYDEYEARRVAPLLPHIKRALSLHIRIGNLESRLTSLDALVDRLAAPVLLIERSGALLYANSAGQQALREAKYLVLRGGRVQPRNVKQQRQFADMLAAALSDGPSALAAQENFAMRLLDSEGHGAALLVNSLRGQAGLGGMPRADAVLFLIPTDEKTTISALRLQILFGLTPAETRLAEYLALGKNLTEIAEYFHLSRDTLKSQLRSLFGKTRTSRQGELVALLLSSISVPLA